jgi:hypothetical protein
LRPIAGGVELAGTACKAMKLEPPELTMSFLL